MILIYSFSQGQPGSMKSGLSPWRPAMEEFPQSFVVPPKLQEIDTILLIK
jgi:hypothetical protein